MRRPIITINLKDQVFIMTIQQSECCVPIDSFYYLPM